VWFDKDDLRAGCTNCTQASAILALPLRP
jgi:hypothetical protein